MKRARESVADVSRRLIEAAYPNKDSSWIDHQVDLALDRIEQAGPSSADARPAPALPAGSAASAPGRRQRFPYRIFTAGVLIVLAAVVALWQGEWFAKAALNNRGVYSLAAGAVVALVVTVVLHARKGREQLLSCRVRINSRIEVDAFGISDVARNQRPDTAARDDLGMVVARVKNMGRRPIEIDDYVAPLRLTFPGREVVTVDVTESEPARLQEVIPEDPGFHVGMDRITLPKIRLNPENSFKLVVVLSGTRTGTEHKVDIDGRLQGGRVTTEATEPRLRRGTVIGGALTLLLAGALAVVMLLNYTRPFAEHPSGLMCVPGKLMAEGSSAFGLATTKVAGSYHAYCPDSTIDVATPGSKEGVRRLQDQQDNQLALSDGMVDPREFPDSHLVARPVAVVPFTFVVNDSAPVRSLTLEQARKIFTGQVSRWSEITGNPADTGEIPVVVRRTGSGTRNAMEQYVLGVGQANRTSDSCAEQRPDKRSGPLVCERGSTSELVDEVSRVPNAIGYADVPDVLQAAKVKPVTLDGRGPDLRDIRDGYPFWTVEYVYSNGPLMDDSLAAAFTAYLSSPEGESTMRSFKYYSCSGVHMEPLCNTNR